MLTENHPNARWLRATYAGVGEIRATVGLSEEQKNERIAEHQRSLMTKISPSFVIHTGGVRLAATGDAAFMAKYGRRRESLSDANVHATQVDQVLADDTYAIVHATFKTTRGEREWVRDSMGAWRFQDGLAVEHWELANGPEWDDFYLSGDPEFTTGTAEDFWTKDL